jgi:heme A synthase
MLRSRLHTALAVTVVWTLALLFLGSVVHATESSLACPDWPTCFGTMMPEMEGGVFWEHLHRLVAGGLILMFGLATWFAFREAGDRRWLVRASVAGVLLLLVQAVFGGLTVIYRLPDAVSTTHLTLAFGFLSLAVVLATATSPRRAGESARTPAVQGVLRRWGTGAAVLVFVQSIVGGVVRHTDAGMACPDFPTCLGQWVPPLETHFVAIHFTHRVAGVLATLAVVGLAWALVKAGADDRLRRWAWGAVVLVVAQFTLGVVSVFTILGVVPVSLHTLGAAALLAVLVHLATLGRMAGVGPSANAPAEGSVAGAA